MLHMCYDRLMCTMQGAGADNTKLEHIDSKVSYRISFRGGGGGGGEERALLYSCIISATPVEASTAE